jgi:uncharacterized protein DUF5343
MVTTVKENVNFPMISANAWWALRRKFNQTPSLRITDTFLASLLKMKPISARNLISPLKRIGLIDSEGKPTERALRWRNDAYYRQVCEEIRQEIYPEELLNLFSGPDISRSSLEDWFANTAAVGESAKKMMAAFYLLLTDADPTKQDSASSSAKSIKPTNDKPLKTRSRGMCKEVSNGAVATASIEPDVKTSSNRVNLNGFSPSLHIDIQIHIASDASTDQIDQIFASMAKHLYKGSSVNE